MYPVLGAAILIGGAAIVTAGLGYIAYKAVRGIFRGASKLLGFNSPHNTGKNDPETQPLRSEESATFYAVKNHDETMRRRAEEVRANTAKTRAHTSKIREDRQRQRQQFDALKTETRELNSDLKKTLATTTKLREELEVSNREVEESLGTTETDSWKDMQKGLAALEKKLPIMQAETRRQLAECDKNLAEGDRRLAEGARELEEDKRQLLSEKPGHRRTLLRLFDEGNEPEDIRNKEGFIFTSDEEFYSSLFEEDKYDEAHLQYDMPASEQALFEPQLIGRRMSI